MARGRSAGRRGGRLGSGPRCEWIGGRLSPPFFVDDRDEPYRAELVVWKEEPSGLVVGSQVFAPEDAEGAVARVLLAALAKPLAGAPRRPDAIRVADPRDADEVRAAIAGSIPVAVASTPELDVFLEEMLASMGRPEGNESYLERGRIPPAAVARLFDAAEILYRIAPWKTATDDQVLRMDIPALDVSGACLSIIGNLGESLGVLVFPSLAGYEAFLRGADAPLRRRRGRPDLGTGWLALHFERGADLPASMRREVAAHGWRVADANAYPRVERVDRDGARRPLVERDLRIAAACAASLSAFFVKHGDLFAVEEIAPVCESWFDGDDLEVRFTAPYQASHLFEVNDPGASSHASPESPARPKVGRNDPCPCGSGRKYKRCHLLRDEAERSAGAAAHPAHDLDQRLVRALSDFALARFGAAWQRFAEDFHDEESALQLSVPWSVFHYQVDGAPVFAWYLAEQGGRLSRAERAWLAAQGAAWLSVWEVTAVVPGESLGLRDLLSGETRCVREASASQTLVVRDALLGRVVDHEGVALLCGAHPRALPPFAAAEVVRSAKGRARRKASVPLVRLRDERFGRTLIRIWEETLAALDAERSAPPELCNTDGDPLLPTTDHFEIAPGARAAVEAALAALPGAEAGEEGGDLGVFAFLRPGSPPDPGFGDTLVGRARVSDTALRLETNSRERADALRARVEAACGERIRHRVREHADPLSSKAPRPAPGPAPEPPPDAQELLLAVKRRYYAEWPDQPLPALGGQTPRAAARTARGRDAVDVLLKEMENLEHRSAGGAVFDFSEIRRALGLE